MINFVDVAMSPTPMCHSSKSHMLPSFLHCMLFQNTPRCMVILNFIATTISEAAVTPIAVSVPLAILFCIAAVIICLIVSIMFRRFKRKGGMLNDFFILL